MKKRSDKDIVDKALKSADVCKRVQNSDDEVYRDVKQRLSKSYPNSVITFVFMRDLDSNGLPRTETFDCTIKGWHTVGRCYTTETRYITVLCNGDHAKVITQTHTVRSR